MSVSPFPLPVMFTAWTFRDGAGIAGEVIRRAKLMGAKTVAVQLSEDTPADSTDEGRTLDPSDVKAMKDAGLFVVGWDLPGSPAVTQFLLNHLGVDGWMPQVEGPGQRDALFNALKAGVGKGLPKALVCTYGGLDTKADVAALRALWPDVVAFIECYKADGPPHEQIDTMLWQGTQYGFDKTRLLALVGTWRGEMRVDYPQLDPAEYGGIYLAESTTDAQLKAFATLNGSTPEPPPAPTPSADPAACNRVAAGAAHLWLDPLLPDRKELSRLRCIADIAESGDVDWTEMRGDVRAALDGDVTVPPEVLAELAQVKTDLAKVREQRDAEVAARVEVQSLLNEAQAKIAAATAALS